MAKVKYAKGLEGLTYGDVQGLIEIREDNHEQIINALNTAVAAALEEIGIVAERFAKVACPVDTGRLRNSITHALDMSTQDVYVGTNVPYAPYIELGTSRASAFPFLRPAAQGHEDFYREILKKHLENA